MMSGSGSDRLEGGQLADVIWGGAGDDFIWGGFGREQVDLLKGEAGNDQLIADGGNDWLDGGEGNDFVNAVGGAGAGKYEGGSGADMFAADRSVGTERMVLNLADPSVVSDLGHGGTATGFEQAQFRAGSGNDRLTGGGLADTLHGGGGNDVVSGGGGADTIDGGAGDDELVGGGANDLLNGGDGVDTARFSAQSSNYSFERLADGGLRVTDLRAADPANPSAQTDGVDTLYGVEMLQFTDRTVSADEVGRTSRRRWRWRTRRPPTSGPPSASTCWPTTATRTATP
jgi:Ca2+-binding RTX toxin-like protein